MFTEVRGGAATGQGKAGRQDAALILSVANIPDRLSLPHTAPPRRLQGTLSQLFSVAYVT